METLVADKFNPRTDPDRPKRGSIIEDKGIKYEVRKVSYTTLGRVIAYRNTNVNDAIKKCVFDIRLFKMHSTNASVIWIAWGNKVEEKL
jgi:hypothetical protein